MVFLFGLILVSALVNVGLDIWLLYQLRKYA